MKDKLKIVYIGNKGHHSANVNSAIKGDVRFNTTAVAPGDLDEDIDGFYEYLQEDSPDIKKYYSYQEMLQNEKPDVAVISPRFDLTAKICMECARRKIHIIAEKPVALNLKDLSSLEKAVKESGVCFTAMHFLRFQGEFYGAIQAVKRGEIGQVRLVNAQKSYKLGKRDDFFKNKETYGGTIPWVGIHGLDLIYSVTGPIFTKVYASQSTVGNMNHGDLEASCLCHFTLENGVAASLSIDYLRPAEALTHGDDRLRVVGTEGIVEVKDGILTITNGKGINVPDTPNDENIVMGFLEEVMGKKECELPAEEIFYITKVALIAREAAQREEVLIIK